MRYDDHPSISQSMAVSEQFTTSALQCRRHSPHDFAPSPTLNLLPQQIRYGLINRTYDIGKAKQRLRYKPTVSMAEAIRRAGESFATKEKKDE